MPKLSFIRVNTVAKYDRYDAIDEAKYAITSSGGWLTDYRMFSNTSICIQFEIELKDTLTLYSRLQQTGLKLTDESHAAFSQVSAIVSEISGAGNPDLRGTLQITFVHDDPLQIIEVPPLEL